MGHLRSTRWLVAIGSAAICGLVSCSGSAPIAGIKVTGPISLLDLFPQADKTTAISSKLQENVNVKEVSVAGKPERVLFLHPESEVTFPLRIEFAAILETAVALLPDGWQSGGDGVTFYVSVRREGEVLPTYLFSQHVRPQVFPEHRGWWPVRLDLTSLLNTDFELVLGTHPGPNLDTTWDWAVWKNPRIYNPAIDSDEFPPVPQTR